MIPRYANPFITSIFGDTNRVGLWQRTELAVIQAREEAGEIPQGTHTAIRQALEATLCDEVWWHQKDDEIHHDLQAWVEERQRFIPHTLQQYWHNGITSYDTEESAFVQMLKDAGTLIFPKYLKIKITLGELAIKYRYTPMMARTHGQWADLQSFGKRCLSWYQDMMTAYCYFETESLNLDKSRISGAVGNYTGIHPDIEKAALKIMDFVPYYGATQILPRILFAPLASGLYGLVAQLNKIATDIRLGARSGYAIVEEPRGKKQKGSSAMPHKKNPIQLEKISGMERIAKGQLDTILANIQTWEERDIGQSSAERVAWADLFHVACHTLDVMNKVLGKLVVKPDIMLQEIVDSHGCYAASVAKETLEALGQQYSLSAMDSWRIVQLAAFNALEPTPHATNLRIKPAASLCEADDILTRADQYVVSSNTGSIKDIIAEGRLQHTDDVELADGEVDQWNDVLSKIFSDQTNRHQWEHIFTIEYLLRNEPRLFQEILQI